MLKMFSPLKQSVWPLWSRLHLMSKVCRAPNYVGVLFFIHKNKQDIARSIVCGNRFLKFNSFSPQQLGVPASSIRQTFEHLANIVGDRPILTIGRRDREILGYDFDDIFSNILRVEVALLPNRFSGSRRYSGYMLDRIGPYFDGTCATSLEIELNSLKTDWWKNDTEACMFLDEYRASVLTKYMFADMGSTTIPEHADTLIVGQCTGDQALKYTRGPFNNNVDLVVRVVDETSFGRIYYRAHPRNLTNPTELAEISRRAKGRVTILESGTSFIDVLRNRPRVATMTSGAGLEAAIRGCRVTCYSTSFYSNWGFTNDSTPCERRSNKLTVEDVFLYVYTKYSTYLHPYSTNTITPLQALRGVLV